MNWNDVRYFLAVSRQGGLTGAAKELSVSPSTVARRIEMLEEALRTRLFERHLDGYELTESGRSMVAKAMAIEAGMTEMADDLAGDDGRISGTVRLVTVETLAHYLIIPQLAALQDRHPDLALGVAVNASFARLPQREADIGLRLCRPESGNFLVKRVGSFTLGLYASTDYLARHPVGESAVPLEAHAIIGWSDPLSFVAVPKALQSWTNGSRAVLTVDSMAATMLALKSGQGLGVLPCIMGDADDSLVRVRPELCHQVESIWLVVHEDIRRARRIRTVCEFLETIVNGRQAQLTGKWGGPSIAASQPPV